MKASLNSLHHQDSDWQRELEFYKEEIAILTTRLEEVTKENTGSDVMKEVEHFQNKFIMLREQVDTLHHDINVREQGVEAIAKEKPEHIDERFNKVKDSVLNRMKELAASVADTRFEFNRFLAKTL
ncbi:MAG TPA: hypothetical protein VG603_03800 [Chitinophagales bacterium]|nr:hypothetical protein [Chitinophagales bacterium]